MLYDGTHRRRLFPSSVKAFLCLFIIIGFLYGGWQARRFFPYPAVLARFGVENWQTWEFHDYFNLDQNTISVVVEGQRLTNMDMPPMFFQDDINFTAAFVREHIDPFMFWDEGARALFVSDDESVSRLSPTLFDGHAWLSLSWLQARYSNFSIEHLAEHNIVVIRNLDEPEGRDTTALRRASVRYRPDSTAFITQTIIPGDALTTFYIDNGFVRVRTSDGLLGYVLTNEVDLSYEPQVVQTPPFIPSPNINLSWELITAQAANTNAMNRPFPEGLTVISPTWFTFNPYTLDGEIISLASRDYVDWAHSQGVEVWAHIFDTNPTISRAILTNYQAREWAIEQLIGFVLTYNLDGINVNFEYVPSDVGGYYLQFLRELAPEMRRIGSTLSVATFVPAPWRSHYYHHLVGRTVDFVAIMTYDEHVGASENPGPVASLPFVEQFVVESLNLIPAEKLLMGLPFYNRVWRVLPDGSHTASAYGFSRPWVLIEEWDITPVWDPIIGSYYANFVENGVTYRIWVECERSIAYKLKIFSEHNLAGVASWRRGLETEGVWEQIQLAMDN